MSDSLSDRYSELLTGSYHCVDRIVLNAYFRMGHAPGGFRAWWGCPDRIGGDAGQHTPDAHAGASAAAFTGMRKPRVFRLCIVQPGSASMSSPNNTWQRRKSRKACF